MTTDELLAVVERARTRLEVAEAYAEVLPVGGRSGAGVDWARVNRAIVERWSEGGLARVKEMAWRIVGN